MSACSAEWNERLSALLDGELSPLEARAAAAHLQRCVACAAARRDYLDLSRRLSRARAPRPATRARWRRAPLAFAAALAAAAAALLVARPRGFNDALAAEVERSHFRAFAGATPCEFSSGDPAQVRAWLRKAVGYDVEVPALEGATLLGARRCELHGVPTAALLYRRGPAGLTLFVPVPHSRAEAEASRFGEARGRCTTGKLGESICALGGRRGAAVAVADARPEVVLAAARAATR